MLPFLQGFGLGGGLIVAIGAQNAFVLTQGVRRRHQLSIALVCAGCDAVLILLGAAGVGAFVALNPWLLHLTTWGGALFLGWYGALALRSVWQGNSLETGGGEESSRSAIIMTTLAITLCNPHVYLDTLVLLGGISGRFQESERLIFACGAISASFLWFFSLSYGAGFLAPLFRTRSAWRVLDGLVCLTMWSIAASLLLNRTV